MVVSIPSLETSWLSRADKQLPVPVVMFAPISTAGIYYSVYREEVEICGAFVPRDKGIIVLSTEFEARDTGAVMAHEWRHHWQCCSGWVLDSLGWTHSEDYDAELRRYFRSSRSEMDALLFEMRRERATYHEEWAEIVLH